MDLVETTTANATPILTPTVEEDATDQVNSDYQMFLEMLTAQMENQDPLDPVDSTEFATQLAQFSAVEQQVNTNELLTQLSEQVEALNVSELAQWVGMNARAIMQVAFDGAPVSIEISPAEHATSAQLVVYDSRGREVQRQEIAPESTILDWVGVDDLGSPLPPGRYDIVVESYSNGELFSTDPVLVEGRIVEARNEGGRPVLLMDSGQEVDSSRIIGLRSPV